VTQPFTDKGQDSENIYNKAVIVPIASVPCIILGNGRKRTAFGNKRTKFRCLHGGLQ